MKDDNSPIGDNWNDLEQTLLTPGERNEIDLKVQITAAIIKARHAQGLTQKEIEERSGVRQPVIARMEKGTTDPHLSTILKVLGAMGKTLDVVPIDKKKTCC